MKKEEIEAILKTELATINNFDNWHGISVKNLSKFLVAPYEVFVDPDDGGESKPRNMWVVLHERTNPDEGYLVAYDPFSKGWSLLERTPVTEKSFIQVTAGESLADVLESM